MIQILQFRHEDQSQTKDLNENSLKSNDGPKMNDHKNTM